MIKLFLITLLCATLVLANSPGRNSQDAWKSNGFDSKGDHLGHGNLVRRSAKGGPPGGGVGGGASMGAGVGWDVNGGGK